MTKKQEAEQLDLETANASALAQQDAETMPIVAVNDSDWGDVSVDSRDLVLPKVLLMQPTSVAVSEGKAVMGDIINSLTGEVIGNAEKKPVRVLPFYCKKSYVINKRVGDKYEFSHIIPDDGRILPFEEDIGGVKFQNMHQYEFFCMTEDMSMPHVISFRSTSHKIGKQLFTFMYVNNKAAGLTPASSWITVGGVRTKNDKGTFMLYNFKPDSRSSAEEIETCKMWVQTIKSSTVDVVEEREASSAKTSTIF